MDRVAMDEIQLMISLPDPILWSHPSRQFTTISIAFKN